MPEVSSGFENSIFQKNPQDNILQDLGEREYHLVIPLVTLVLPSSEMT